jgi:hypothetical protein
MPPPTAWQRLGTAAGQAPDAPADPFTRIVEDTNVPISFPVYAPHATPPRAASTRPTRESLYRRLSFRRTIIPILLTQGVALPALAAWWFLLDQDSPLKAVGLVLPLTLLAVGIVMLGLAVLNMVQVRHQLRSGDARAGAAAAAR